MTPPHPNEPSTTPEACEGLQSAVRHLLEALPPLLPRREAQGLALRLIEAPATLQLARLRADHRAHRPEVALALVETAYRLAAADGEASLAAARLALATVARCRLPDAYRPLLFDLKAEARALVANGLRIRGELLAADRLWPRAKLEAGLGSGDALLDARLCWVEAALRRDQRRFAQAISLLRRAARLLAELGEHASLLTVEASLAIAQYYSGSVREALAQSAKSLARPGSGESPAQLFFLVHNFALYAADLGLISVTFRILNATHHLYERFSTPLTNLRLEWLLARLHVQVGRPDLAVSLFQQVRAGFLERGLPYDAALASLDLALLYAQRRQLTPMAELAWEMYPVFAALDLPGEASAALLLFADAARAYGANLEMVREALRHLDHRQRNTFLDAIEPQPRA